MKEKTKRKMLGNRLYAIYRRIRYIRFLKRKRKEHRRALKAEKRLEALEFKANLKKQKQLEKENTRLKRKQLKLERKLQKKGIDTTVEAPVIPEPEKVNLPKPDYTQDGEELTDKQIRKNIKEKLKEEKRLEKLQRKKERLEKKAELREIKERLKKQKQLEKEELQSQKRRRNLEEWLAKRKRRKLQPYLYRRRLRAIFHGLRSINKDTFKRWFHWLILITGDGRARVTFFTMLLNATVTFILAYLVLYIVGQIITVWAAYTFEYKTIVFFNKIYYNIDSDEWTGDAVKILYSIKPAIGLILGIVGIIVYSSIRNGIGRFKLFFLWLFIHGMVMFFGSLLMGTLLNKGFGWVISYLYYKDTGKMIFSILSIFALFTTGAGVARSFLISGNSYFNSMDSSARKFLLIGQIIIPSLLGTAALIFLKIPIDLYYTTEEETLYEIFKLLTITLVVIPIIATISSYQEVFFDEDPRRIRLLWLTLIFTLTLYGGFYFYFYEGINFGPAG